MAQSSRVGKSVRDVPLNVPSIGQGKCVAEFEKDHWAPTKLHFMMQSMHWDWEAELTGKI